MRGRPLRLVLDTNVLVAGMRSAGGASSALLKALERSQFRAVASTPLLFEYETVLTRSEHLAAVGMTNAEMTRYLDVFALMIERAEPHFSWRPQLADAADEMVLETAVNGRADAIVTFNRRHLAPASRFGVRLWTPSEAIEGIRHGWR